MTPPTPSEARRITPDCHGLDTPQRVCFYEQDFYVLSNFSAFQIAWDDGLIFPTSEHVYHWEKFNTAFKPAENETQRRIREATSAHEAFKIAERHRATRRPNWDSEKVAMMRTILRAKAQQHEYVRRKLLATGKRELVENSWRDDFWGWGPNRDGQNILGKLWMEIRADIRAANAIEGIWPTAPTQPPAPLAGGTDDWPNTHGRVVDAAGNAITGESDSLTAPVPTEAGAGCKQEGTAGSPVPLAGYKEGRPVSPATGEREAELRAAIRQVLDYDDSVETYSKETVDGLIASLTPLLDHREGELETAKFATHQHQQYAHMMQEQRSEIAKAYNKMEGELAAKDAEIATAHTHMDKLREHRNELDAACHELEGKLREAEAARGEAEKDTALLNAFEAIRSDDVQTRQISEDEIEPELLGHYWTTVSVQSTSVREAIQATLAATRA